MDNRVSIFQELHNEEVEELMSRPPHWLLRCGTGLLFGCMVTLIAGLWLIKYPDIVVTPFTLTAGDAPRKVIVRTEGKLMRLLVRDGQNVVRGQTVAFSESMANPDQITDLIQSTNILYDAVKDEDWLLVKKFKLQPFTELGEVQNDFEKFHQDFAMLCSSLNDGFYQKKRTLLVQDYRDLDVMEKILEEQKELTDRDFELAKEEFQIQEKLLNSKAIAILEFKKEKARLMAREMPIKNLASSLMQSKSLKIAKQKELLDLDNTVNQLKVNFMQSVQTLRSSLASWNQRFALYAPVDGTVSFSELLQENQYLEVGREIMSVEPISVIYRGLIKVPQKNLGKINKGQSVIVKLEGYPYREYGIVKAQLTQFSNVPRQDSLYWGYVTFPNGLTTVRGRKLPYRNGLMGSAEIITKERRLTDRLFSAIWLKDH